MSLASSTRTRRIAGLAVATAIAVGFLLTGSAWLGRAVLYVPAGNWAAWFFLAGLNALACVLAAPRAWLQWPARSLFALAVAWYPVSVALMGNLNLSGDNALSGSIWMGYTALLIAGPFSVMVLQLIVSAVVKLKS